ncbi:hypothetical protein BTO32_15390 [Marinobacter lutaoensis]|uniref:Uncharacterized protein n=1 Tax=Marinobacter lutaoensis TaxID=135739 RepID=A0A1V2DPX9_9GAMM|nr:hypothetical protein [Marinobacter lutaoensis]ONF42589.1 hypothetical protein BTO32_15390 [Marinobacter lutaoensis]
MFLTDRVSDLENQVQLSCEYPGQTLMVALAIILNYDNMQSAQDKGAEYSNALECNMVPGAGDAVCIALHELEKGVSKDLDANQMIAQLHARWSEYAGHQKSYKDRVESGIKKAMPFEAEFRSRWDLWKSRSQLGMSAAGKVFS